MCVCVCMRTAAAIQRASIPETIQKKKPTTQQKQQQQQQTTNDKLKPCEINTWSVCNAGKWVWRWVLYTKKLFYHMRYEPNECKSKSKCIKDREGEKAEIDKQRRKNEIFSVVATECEYLGSIVRRFFGKSKAKKYIWSIHTEHFMCTSFVHAINSILKMLLNFLANYYFLSSCNWDLVCVPAVFVHFSIVNFWPCQTHSQRYTFYDMCILWLFST